MSQGTFQTRALYLQLSDVLIERMANGTWKPGTSLPSEQELAREFGVSTGTVRKALEVLVDMRLVTRRQGRGTFVSDQTSDEAGLRFVRLRTARGSHVFGHIRSIEITDGNAIEVECRRLALQAGDKVHRISRTRIDNKTPFMIERASVPAKLFPDLADKVDFADRIVALARHYGIFLGKATEQITIEPVSAEIAHGLGVQGHNDRGVGSRFSRPRWHSCRVAQSLVQFGWPILLGRARLISPSASVACGEQRRTNSQFVDSPDQLKRSELLRDCLS